MCPWQHSLLDPIHCHLSSTSKASLCFHCKLHILRFLMLRLQSPTSKHLSLWPVFVLKRWYVSTNVVPTPTSLKALQWDSVSSNKEKHIENIIVNLSRVVEKETVPGNNQHKDKESRLIWCQRWHNYLVKGLWPLDARISTWTILPQMLTGLGKIVGANLECVMTSTRMVAGQTSPWHPTIFIWLSRGLFG